MEDGSKKVRIKSDQTRIVVDSEASKFAAIFAQMLMDRLPAFAGKCPMAVALACRSFGTIGE